MNTVLDKIFEKKRVRINDKMKKISYTQMEELAKSAPERASFFNALKEASKDRIAIIAELKKASPSLGEIRKNFDVKNLAKSLSKNGASALSVLTEEDFFQGSTENLKIASSATNKPLLCKDFIFSKYQILEAKANGASAVLLIVAMLKADLLKELFDFAHSQNLDVLLETHTQEELDFANSLNAKIIGVNSRNLKTLKIDLSIFESLISKIKDTSIAVAESGILDSKYLKEAYHQGAKAALIGTALMSKQNPETELRNLISQL